ncbi:MAG: hypothetical protein Q9P01_16975 [Anaerolineae bacterium]|nr:hypothetical protein [Anaerolineae bacterium]MDQ7036456.1 hypothetical protein [Anaerolineae bacterium]
MASDVKMQNLVTDVTDALLAGESVDNARRKHDVFSAEGQDLIELIERIHRSMEQVEPAPQFAKNLKADLLGEQSTGVVLRLRKLPARVQYAALAALIGGFVLLLQRMFLGESDTLTEETNPAQEKV